MQHFKFHSATLFLTVLSELKNGFLRDAVDGHKVMTKIGLNFVMLDHLVQGFRVKSYTKDRRPVIEKL